MTGNWTMEYTKDGVKHIHHYTNKINTEGVNYILDIDIDSTADTVCIWPPPKEHQKEPTMDKEILDAVEPLLKTIQEKDKEIAELRWANKIHKKAWVNALCSLKDACQALEEEKLKKVKVPKMSDSQRDKLTPVSGMIQTIFIDGDLVLVKEKA